VLTQTEQRESHYNRARAQRTIRNDPSEEANTENQPMEQAVQQSARELARWWCHNIAHDCASVAQNYSQEVGRAFLARQHRTACTQQNTRKQVAHALCSQLNLSLSSHLKSSLSFTGKVCMNRVLLARSA
jgi:hypothetical protein